MTRWSSWNQGQDTARQDSARLSDTLARTTIRGRVHNQGGGPNDRLEIVPDLAVSGHAAWSGTRKQIYGYDRTTHEHVHYHTDGTTPKAYAAAGKHYITGERVHSAAAVDKAGVLTAPYWKDLHNPSPPLGATYPHEESWYKPDAGTAEILARWHGLDSHGLGFADGTHYQFNPASLLFPANHGFYAQAAVSALGTPASPTVGSSTGGGSTIPYTTMSWAYCWVTSLGRSALSSWVTTIVPANSTYFVQPGAYPSGAIAADAYSRDPSGTVRYVGRTTGASLTVNSLGDFSLEPPAANTTAQSAALAAQVSGGAGVWSGDGHKVRLYVDNGVFVFENSQITLPGGQVVTGADRAQSGTASVTVPDGATPSNYDSGFLSVLFPRPFAGVPRVVANCEDEGWIATPQNRSAVGFDARISRRVPLEKTVYGDQSCTFTAGSNQSNTVTVSFPASPYFASIPVVTTQVNDPNIVAVATNRTVSGFDLTLYYRPALVTGTISTIAAQTITSTPATPAHTHGENAAATYTQHATTDSGGSSHAHDTAIPAVTPLFTGTMPAHPGGSATVSWSAYGTRAAGSITKVVDWVAHL
jgi:hypothetical protein